MLLPNSNKSIMYLFSDLVALVLHDDVWDVVVVLYWIE